MTLEQIDGLALLASVIFYGALFVLALCGVSRNSERLMENFLDQHPATKPADLPGDDKGESAASTNSTRAASPTAASLSRF